jgi:hypothetical protein
VRGEDGAVLGEVGVPVAVDDEADEQPASRRATAVTAVAVSVVRTIWPA